MELLNKLIIDKCIEEIDQELFDKLCIVILACNEELEYEVSGVLYNVAKTYNLNYKDKYSEHIKEEK